MQVICWDWGKVLSPLFLLQYHFMPVLYLDLENFCCYGIVDLGLVILISWLFGRFVLNLVNFSVSSEVHISGLLLLFGFGILG